METIQEKRQAIFDTAARFLAAQGSRAMHENGCAYIANNGKRCAVGALMTEEHARAADTEQHTVYGIMTARLLPADIAGRDIGESAHFLNWLQSCHDGADDSDFVGTWAPEMRAMAARWGLNTIALDTALAAREVV